MTDNRTMGFNDTPQDIVVPENVKRKCTHKGTLQRWNNDKDYCEYCKTWVYKT